MLDLLQLQVISGAVPEMWPSFEVWLAAQKLHPNSAMSLHIALLIHLWHHAQLHCAARLQSQDSSLLYPASPLWSNDC